MFSHTAGGEKALKSLLYYLGSRRDALLTHSLVEMTREAGKEVTTVRGVIAESRALDLHYIPSRYPDGLPSGYPHRFYGQETAEQAIHAAKKIFQVVTDYYSSTKEADILAEDE